MMSQRYQTINALKKITSFQNFVENLDACGFTIAGINSENVFTLCDQFADNIVWHTGNPDTDPWEWRIRVLEERNDIAYAKLFFKKGGYIKRDHYAQFMAIRRPYSSVHAAYAEGMLDAYAKRLCEAIAHAGAIPIHELKKLFGVTRENAWRFERALVELQMSLYITICGNRQKISSDGASYGWHSTMFCTVEAFWGDEIVYEARYIDPVAAYRDLELQIYTINPGAVPRRVRTSICGLSPFPGRPKS